MTNIDDIEKLYDLKEKGVISEQEFNEKKAALLNAPTEATDKKNQVAYCVLALFLGLLGIHNFYAGRWKRGLTQLLFTFPFSIPTLGITYIVSSIWSTINIFTIHTDGKGNEFEPEPTAKIICGIFAIIFSIINCIYLAFVMVVLIAGAIEGYKEAMENYKTKATGGVDYSMMMENDKTDALTEKVKFIAQQTHVLFDGEYKTGSIAGYLHDAGMVTDVNNPFGGELIVTGENDNFTIKANNVPKEACIKLLRTDWGYRGYNNGFLQIQVAENPAITSVNGVSTATAMSNCTSSINEITWAFK